MGIKNGFFEIYNRETGVYGSRCFVRRYSSNEGVLNRLDLYRELNGHINYVKTLEFNSSGDLLVSSSLDRQVIFWNWETNTQRLSYDSGHSRKVFQAKIMPSTADKKIVTSAGDGQLRLGEVSEDGRVDTKCLEMRRGCIYGVAVEPEHPHILYSCGDNAFIHHFDLRTCTPTKLFRCIKFKKIDPLMGAPYGLGLHAMVFDPMNPNYFCVGGSDPYARLYDVRKLRRDASSNLDKPVNIFAPHHLNTSSDTHITGLAYSNSSELLVTYADELIYLFQKNMGLGHSPSSADILKLDKPQAFMGHRNCLALKGVNFLGPNDDYILSGSDDGHIFIWKKNGAKLVRVIKGNCPVHQIAPHPHIQIFATCGVENSVKVWAPMENDAPPLPCNIDEIMESNREARAVQLQRLILIRSRGRIVYPGLGESSQWLEMCGDVGMVIFCVSLSDYDQFSADGNGSLTNKMLQSRAFFESIITHPTFEQMNFLLILNEFYWFEEKIGQVPLTQGNWFHDFDPVYTSYLGHRAYEYIAVRRLYSSLTGKKLFVSLVEAFEPYGSYSVDESLKYSAEILKWDEGRGNGYFSDPDSFYSDSDSDSGSD